MKLVLKVKIVSISEIMKILDWITALELSVKIFLLIARKDFLILEISWLHIGTSDIVVEWLPSITTFSKNWVPQTVHFLEVAFPNTVTDGI